MLIRVSGGSGGIGEYLARGRKSGRDYDRDELDQRVLLSGDVEQLETIIGSFDKGQQYEKYLHITLSFKEVHLDEAILKSINQQFHDFIFQACVDDEFYYYSEAHLPKLKSLPDKTGNTFERFPHIHVVIPEYNLYTGKRENPLNKISSITQYIDAFQEKINSEYGIESPKDNKRELSSGREESIARYQISPDMPIKEIKTRLYQFIQNNAEIHTVEELAASIKPFGVSVKVRDSKSFGGKYINFSFDHEGKRKAVNLKDAVFLDAYLSSRNTALAQDFLSQHQMPETEQENLLQDWRDFAALEARFLQKASPTEREAYYQSDKTQQLTWLDTRWESHKAMIETLVHEDESLQAEAALIPIESFDFVRNGEMHMDDLPHLDDFAHMEDIRHLEDIPHFTDLLQENYASQFTSRTRASRGSESYRSRFGLTAATTREPQDLVHDLPSSSHHGSTRERKYFVDSNLLQEHQRNGLERDQENSYSDLYLVRHDEIAKQYVIQTITARKEQSSWKDKINHIDGRVLLDYLSYHYHLNTREISVERNKDGYDRLVVAMPSTAASKPVIRRLSAADVLTKYMHLSWPDAKRVLDSVLEQQERGGYRQQAMTSKLMWRRFQQHEAQLPGLSGVHHDYRQQRNQIKARWRWDYDHSQTAAQNAVKRRLYRQQRTAELEQAKSDWQEAQVYYRMRPHERYLKYLQDEAKAGNNMALGELQRIYPTEDDKRLTNALTIELRNPRQALPPFKPFDLGYEIKVQKNGTIEYRDEQAQAVIIDRYQSIQVKVRTEEIITQALEIAKARYGANDFEIRNARQSDIAAIQAAVDRAGVNITLIGTDSKREISTDNIAKTKAQRDR